MFVISVNNFIFEIWGRLRMLRFSTNKKQAEDMRDLSQEGCIGPAQSQGHNRHQLSPQRPMIEI